MVSFFFSYAHKDEQYRDELEIHLAMLKREGTISAWHDRRIDAGSELHDEISEHLEQANIILLLVSPYFLASDYCYEREMARALERQRNGEAVVIPVIVHPCDWKTAPFSHLLATPTDGKPISKFPNLHDAYLSIVTDIRQAISKMGMTSPKKDTARPDRLKPPRAVPQKRSSNLRVKRDFTEHEQDEFLDQSFEFIANFFEGSLDELKTRSPGIDVRFKRIDVRQFTAAVYRNGSKRTACRISFGAKSGFGNGITYSSSESESGVNEILSVENDGHTLLLKPMWSFQGGSGHLTQEGAAEHL
jgi:hypothetical protein